MDSPNSECSSNLFLENNLDYLEIDGIDKESGDNIQNLINEFEKMWNTKMTEKGKKCLRILE